MIFKTYLKMAGIYFKPEISYRNGSWLPIFKLADHLLAEVIFFKLSKIVDLLFLYDGGLRPGIFLLYVFGLIDFYFSSKF